MNIHDYISSGVLESYVMGDLTDQEMRKVECMALVHDEISKELKVVEETFEQMALETAVAPSAGLKEKIWAELEQSDSIVSKPTILIEPEATPVVKLDTRDSSSGSKSINWGWAAAIAAVIGLAGLGYQGYEKDQQIAGIMDNQNKKQEILEERLAEVNKELIARDEFMADLQSDMGILRDASYLPVRLKGTENAPNSLASVYWNAEKAETYLSVENMAALPVGKVYQLWALDDGVPVDAGIFTLDDKGLVKMKSIHSGQAFAVTIEEEGGAISPALETLQVIGEV